MNILILNWRDTKHPKSGGAEIVTLEHAKGWVKAGHSVTWFTAGFAGASRDERIDGVKIIRSAGSIRVYLAAPFFYLLHRRDFDIVIDEIHANPFFTPLFVRKPKIAFIHEVAGEIWDYMSFFPLNTIGKFLEPTYFKLYKDVPFWTDAPSTIKDLLAFGISPSHCVAIPCPITNKLLTKKPQKEKNTTCIFVSRVVKMKGIEEVIKAFSFIVKEDQHAQLWIVGGGESSYIQKLKEMLKEYEISENVQFIGKVSEEEKLRLMRRAHVLLHGSVKEGWGLVVLEAASQWTPSIVYNVSGLKDVVRNGVTGIVIDHNSPHEMAHEALKLFSDQKRYFLMQKRGLEWVKSITWTKAVKQSLQLLNRTYASNTK